MNFLAHFFLDREHPESAFAVGAATPDLLSIYNPSLRVKPHHLERMDKALLESVDLPLIDGIQRHFDADAVFHSSDFFTTQTRFVSDEIKKRLPDTPVPRKYFIAHILLELVLDKVLIADHPELLSEYYLHYQNTSPFESIRRSTELVTQKRLPNYEQFLIKFQQHRYLYQYQQWDHITFVLKKILKRVGIRERAFLESKAFFELMQDFQDHLHTEYQGLFETIEQKIELRRNPGSQA